MECGVKERIDCVQSIVLSFEEELFLDILHLEKYQLHTPHSTLHTPPYYISCIFPVSVIKYLDRK